MATRPRILIVDDETGIRSALGRWFCIRGFQVDEAADGAEAVQKCRQGVYDVVTMDLEMPRMNGLEAIEAIGTLRPGMPVIILTGFLQDIEIRPDCHAARVLTKPIRLQELEKHVRDVLSTNRPAQDPLFGHTS